MAGGAIGDDLFAELTQAGYVVKTKDGRRNRYRIEADRELSEQVIPDRTTSHLLQLLGDDSFN